ncbi:hypothetical protein AB0P02_19040 [Streptomyces griseoluteus]|uniref:hypothetical protein n=1 Tax=Streptomyces griseoluteus TaxID=29306 RepID=UPI0034173001
MSEQPAVITGIRPGLVVRTEDYGRNPRADWLCACGHHQQARGEAAVQQLAASVRVGHCPHTQGAAA